MPELTAVIRLFAAIYLTCALTMGPGAGAQSGKPQTKSTPKQHRATLNWSHSPDAQKLGARLKYVVYRSDGKRDAKGATECAGKFRKIAQLKASATTYTDRSVKGGHVYCYRVTSLLGKKESPATPTVVADIPPD